MKDLQIFKNTEFGELEVILINDKPHFPATECAKILGHKNPERAVREFCIGVTETVTPSNGGTQKKNYIPEGDLYRLIIRSKLPTAQRFEKWVFDEVLPSIREHGIYVTPAVAEKMVNDPDFIIELGKKLKAQQEKINSLQHEAKTNKPKVVFADAVKASDTTIAVGALAKLLKQNCVKVGRTRLFKWLRENGYLMRIRGAEYNLPTQSAMEKGLFEIEEKLRIIPGKAPFLDRKTYITGKGQAYFIGKFILKARQNDLFAGHC